jgi:hypothetical protein
MAFWRAGSRIVPLLLTLSSFSRAAAAEGGFADPPDRPLVTTPPYGPSQPEHGNSEWEDPPPVQGSSVRVNVGPTLRVAEANTNGGLYVALDVGSRAAGLRASGAWVRAAAERGVSQYTAELWIDFGVGRELHPIIGAGAGVARVESAGEAGEETATLGIGVMRGSVDYVLPVAGVDARVGLDVIGCVPATPGGASADARPWFLTVGHVAVGF